MSRDYWIVSVRDWKLPTKSFMIIHCYEFKNPINQIFPSFYRYQEFHIKTYLYVNPVNIEKEQKFSEQKVDGYLMLLHLQVAQKKSQMDSLLDINLYNRSRTILNKCTSYIFFISFPKNLTENRLTLICINIRTVEVATIFMIMNLMPPINKSPNESFDPKRSSHQIRV